MLAKAFAVLPESQFKSLAVIYIYNVNNSLRQFVKVHERILSPLKVNFLFLPWSYFLLWALFPSSDFASYL